MTREIVKVLDVGKKITLTIERRNEDFGYSLLDMKSVYYRKGFLGEFCGGFANVEEAEAAGLLHLKEKR